MGVLDLWKIVDRFKSRCKGRGWEVLSYGDMVYVGEEYHNFLCVREIQPITFTKVALSEKCSIKVGTSYSVVDISYNAWICLTPPFSSIKEILQENPEILSRNAVFDLSEFSNLRRCKILNKTSSVVFKEFERFLIEDLNCVFERPQNLNLEATV